MILCCSDSSSGAQLLFHVRSKVQYLGTAQQLGAVGAKVPKCPKVDT
jgi:hypothetical protein